MHYFPIALPVFVVLTAAFLLLAVMVSFGVLRYAYGRMGIAPQYVLSILLLTLVGSYINIPIMHFPNERIIPPVATALVALIISRTFAPPLAYVSGSLGTLIGADLCNLGAVQELGAPLVSIGAAGTFDGIFVTGLVAVLLASLLAPQKQDSGFGIR
jgi:uncharacterized membrane protein